MNCPHCDGPLKFAVYPGKQNSSPKRNLFQVVTSLVEQPEPLVRLITTLDGQMNIDELEITDGEFINIAKAMRRNGWLFSTEALNRWGEFSTYRANEIANHLSDKGLRFVTRQNRSTLLPRLVSHLRNAL